MDRFKGYSKVATSDKMMRIIRRERILSVLIGNASITSIPEEEARIFLKKYSHDKDLYDSKCAGLTRMSFSEPLEHRDYFEWKVSMIEKTKWLFDLRTTVDDECYKASWQDTKKLRIYKKWLHKGKQFTCENVLKYMYSNLFLAILSMEKGYINKDNQLEIDLKFNHRLSSRLLVQWLSDVLNLEASFKSDDSLDIIFFPDTVKALSVIEEIIKEVPSKYKQLYI